VLAIGSHDQGFIEEHLFGLPEGDAMKLPVLLNIPVVPIEPNTAVKRVVRPHPISICQTYTPVEVSPG
jgi:hypothetical protein